MSRSALGVYTLPNTVNPTVADTLITSTWANTTLNDVRDALTDSLSRSGQGGMTASLRLIAGTDALPSLSFSAEPTLGFFRKAPGVLGIAVAGVEVGSIDAAGIKTAAGDLYTTPADLVPVLALIDTKLPISDISAFVATLIDDVDAAAARSTLGTDIYKTLPSSVTPLVTGEVYLPTGSFELPPGLSVGNVYPIFNNNPGTINITPGVGVIIELAGTATTGARTLSQKGFASVWVRTTNTYVISGAGVA